MRILLMDKSATVIDFLIVILRCRCSSPKWCPCRFISSVSSSNPGSLLMLSICEVMNYQTNRVLGNCPIQIKCFFFSTSIDTRLLNWIYVVCVYPFHQRCQAGSGPAETLCVDKGNICNEKTKSLTQKK